MAGPPVVPDGPVVPRLLGVVNPYDMALDHELRRWLPEAVSPVSTRTAYHPFGVNEAMATALGEDREVRAAARSLAAVEPEAVVFACTSASFVAGPEGARRLSRVLAEEAGAPAVTTSGALLEALDALGLTRLAIATPYVPRLTALLEDFLAAAGRTVTGAAGLGLEHAIWRIPYRVTADLVRRADSPSAQAVFVSCTNLPTFDVIAPLEAQLGKPLLTANQVTAWAGLRRLGLSLPGDQQLGLRAPVSS